MNGPAVQAGQFCWWQRSRSASPACALCDGLYSVCCIEVQLFQVLNLHSCTCRTEATVSLHVARLRQDSCQLHSNAMHIAVARQMEALRPFAARPGCSVEVG